MVMNQSPHTGSSPQNKFLYNGKEIQDDVIAGQKLDWYDYGWMIYDAAVGRFHTKDRFAEKNYAFSPYQYAGNNPILNIDVNGDSLQATITSSQEWNAFKDIVNTGLEGQFRVFAKATESKGIYLLFITATEGGGDVSKLSEEGLALFNEMVDITSGEGIAKVSLVWNSSKVNIGNYITGEIDMGDISAFNIGGNTIDRGKPVGATQQGKLIHELREQYEKGKAGFTGEQGYRQAHNRAIDAENAVNGNIRLPNRDPFTRGNRAVRQFFREKDGSTSNVVYSINSRRMTVEQPKPSGLIRQ